MSVKCPKCGGISSNQEVCDYCGSILISTVSPETYDEEDSKARKIDVCIAAIQSAFHTSSAIRTFDYFVFPKYYVERTRIDQDEKLNQVIREEVNLYLYDYNPHKLSPSLFGYCECVSNGAVQVNREYVGPSFWIKNNRYIRSYKHAVATNSFDEYGNPHILGTDDSKLNLLILKSDLDYQGVSEKFAQSSYFQSFSQIVDEVNDDIIYYSSFGDDIKALARLIVLITSELFPENYRHDFTTTRQHQNCIDLSIVTRGKAIRTEANHEKWVKERQNKMAGALERVEPPSPSTGNSPWWIWIILLAIVLFIILIVNV